MSSTDLTLSRCSQQEPPKNAIMPMSWPSFNSHELNRPNFVKMLAARAAEERDHADVLAKFQLSRGYSVSLNGFKYENENFGNINSIGDGLDSMIAKEKELTGHLKTLNKKAEDGVPNKTPGLNVNDVLI